MYEYRAAVRNVVDGDTVHAEVDLGCDVRTRMTVRLAGIDAPEMSTEEGKASRSALVSLLGGTDPKGPFQPVTIRTIKDRKEKWHRYLATIVTDTGVDVNEAMVEHGYAVHYDGGKR